VSGVDDPRLGELARLLVDSPVRVTSVPAAEVAERHVADALTGLPRVAAEDGPLADVGSGGGVPGLVLAIVLAPRPVTLVESTGRKAARLAELAALLDLPHVAVVAERAEDYGRGAGRDAFGVVTARALAPPPVAAELCLPLARPGGLVLLYTGAAAPGPLSSVAAELAAEVEAIEHVAGTERRHLVALRKLAPTPERFPRRAGVAARRPLA
jgi:16S rRNA (guanine527-N7)-methyltransferase